MASNIVFDGTKGISLPSFTTTEKNAIVSPATGAVVYDSTLNQESLYNGSAWVNVNSSGNSAITSGTAVSASGTAVDFTGIPSWVKRITVMFNGVSISAQAAPYIQLGGSGGFENSGYSSIAGSISTASNTTNATVTTSYFGLYSGTILSTEFVTGNVIFTNISGNTWTCNASLFSGNRSVSIGGAKSLSDVLTQIRISTSTGNFDAGTINILYE